MSFLYFVPGKKAVTVEAASEMGIRYAFELNPACREVTGPSGERGVLACQAQSHVLYSPERQTWRKIPGNEHGVWVGMWTDAPPKPSDLQRALLISGQWVRLDDDHQWLAPTARRWHEQDGELFWEHNLPTALNLDDDGVFRQSEVKPRYQRLWQLAMRYDRADVEAAAAGMKVFDFPEAIETVVLALQANYRVAALELCMLGVLDNGPMRDAVLSALVDRPRQVEFWKKKLASERHSEEASTGSGSSGLQDAVPDTVQQSLT